jgi:nuclease HARBI1
MYSGYCKDHGMKWQAIVTPDGLISSLHGPYPGPTNDWTIVHNSKVLDKCRTVYGNRQRLYIYGDLAYVSAFGIMGPYQHPGGRHALPHNEHEFNVALSLVRILVEHAFGHVIQQWGFIAFSKGMSEGLSAVATYFTTAVLFTNCLTCFRGSQTSERFGVEPPSIYEYLLYVYNLLPLSNCLK